MKKPIEVGTFLPKDTIVEVGYRKGIDKTAIGCHIVLSKNMIVTEKGEYADDVRIIKNPNGWMFNDMSHRIKTSDFIISIPNQTNKSAVKLLDKEW